MQVVVAIVFTLLAWWAGTALILYLDARPRRTYALSLGLTTALALAAALLLHATKHETSAAAAYLAFGGGLVLWGWHELAFLTGWVTGPRKVACPEGASGWRRFVLATATMIHHELALAATLVAVIVMTWGAPNPVGAWTFGVLWTMRLSAKLNVFLGVRNIAVDFIPEHLRYLASYFGRARINPLMPFSIVAASLVVAYLVLAAEGITEFDVAARTLTATMLALAVLEHLFLALPLPDAVLWRWILSKRTMET